MIRVTQREHLLHCVVPAVDVRAQEAPGIGERAVPAEIANLEAALTFALCLRRSVNGMSAPTKKKAAEIALMLSMGLDLERRKFAIGGNDEAQRRGEEKL